MKPLMSRAACRRIATIIFWVLIFGLPCSRPAGKPPVPAGPGCSDATRACSVGAGFILCAVSKLAHFFAEGVAVAEAGDIQWRDSVFRHIAENQPVDELLKQLLASQGIKASVSPSLSQKTISGNFKTSPSQLFKQLAAAYSLIWHFDGNILYIYTADEVKSKILLLKHATAGEIDRMLRKMNIYNPQFPVRTYDKANMLYVSGPAHYVQLVEEAVKVIDVDQRSDSRVTPASLNPGAKNSEAKTFIDAAAMETVRIFYLKHAWADDKVFRFNNQDTIIKGVGTLLREVVLEQPEIQQAALTEFPIGGKAPPIGARRIEPVAAHYVGRPAVANAGPAIPVAVQTQNIAVQVAPRINAIIVKDSLFKMPFYEELIRQLDVPLELVEIKATIIDINQEEVQNLGIDWSGQQTGDDSSVYGQTDNMMPFGGGLKITTILGGLADNYLLARIRAMEAEGTARIVSRPSVITFNNQEAQFKHSDTFFVRVAGTENVGLYEISTGIILKVTPHIVTGQRYPKITLAINIEDGMVTDKMVDDIPVLKNSSINTQAVVTEKESLLIGGLVYENQGSINRQVPVVGDIPLVGRLFQYQEKTESQTERLFLIRTKIIPTDNLADYNRHSEQRAGTLDTVFSAPSETPAPLARESRGIRVYSTDF